ncbi:hypothetical protein PC113_g2857 [Phytophthora cactorum]|uniref:Uncharacterized protein n=1 Tax=Phytophthora cactorum TaxID=29920 RepID=A0A8T0ZV49_9STRA|nr:hypothetical protein PC111_g2524 [Phytophthora cactorum]KAG2866406.1 hypothetical protein PC113_g2857 [Phytophthora cactorum]
MAALDHARALNGLLALPRLERMLRVYRTWVNVEGVEGGMALTRRELQCVLEFPELDHHVDFLFDTFRCVSSNRKQSVTPRVDLVTLLTTAAMLVQGALADKAGFVFQLVDLDTEDDIVEAELALVISTCCSGLYRLGLIENGDNLSEIDAMVVAYEAFDFVELEDGDKMTFVMFLKWCVFHPRPKALLGRISCLFSMCDAVRNMKDALEERTERLKNAETFLYYNDMHFGSLDEYAEKVRVVVGPIVGKVEATRVNVLLEVDTLTTVKCFAFALPQEGAEMERNCSVPTQECKVQSFQPELFTITGLSPGTAYVLRFLGIRKADRDRCVAVVTTKCRTPASSIPVETLPVPSSSRIRLLNHFIPGSRHQGPRSPETPVYQKIARDSYESPKSTLTIHYGIFLSPQKVSAMLDILKHGDKTRRDRETNECVLDMIKQEYRRVLGGPCVWELLCSHSNWCFDSNESVLFSGFPEWRSSRLAEFAVVGKDLIKLALPVWQSYIGALWGHPQNNANCLELGDGVILAPVMGHFDLQSESGEADCTRQISVVLKTFPSASAVLLLTRDPLFSRVRATYGSDISRSLNNTSVDNARQWRVVQELIEWNLSDVKRQFVMLSFDDVESYQTLVSVTNTALSFTQFVCGPVVDTHSSCTGHLRDQGHARPQTNPTNQLVVRHGALDRRPQYVQISSMRNVGEALMSSTDERQSSGDVDAPYASFQVQLFPLQGQHEINRILGPVVGCVSSRVARVLLECDAEGEIACVAVDRLTLQSHRVVGRVEPYRPVIFNMTELTPGRTYDLSFQGLQNDEPGIFQTPHEHLPAFRLLIVAEDRFLDGTTDVLASFGENLPPSYIGNVVDHFFPVTVLGITSWGMYGKEQARLIHMIFRKLHQNPKFHVVFVCCGAFSSRTTITNKSTNLSFQQVVVGPISNSGLSQRREQAGSTEPTFADEELTACYSIQQEIPARTLKSQQYCSLELVPHSLGASSDVKFYTQHLGEARLILGPIIGRVTPRTARILIELDRPVSSLSCALIDPVTLQSYSTKAQVDAFTPTIIKVEGLHPDTRYTIKFEGLMENKDAVLGHVFTPAWVSLSSEWLVVNCNSMVDFLGLDTTSLPSANPQPRSQWPQILANGMVSFAAKLAGDASHGNGDTLGDHDDARHQNYNPWHSIEDEYLSEPLSGPQLLLHLGGQVDMSRAFTNEELSSLVVRLAGQVESSAHDEDSDDFQRLRSEVRYRLQEVYRVAWGVPPMNRVLRYTSNLMLLNNDADLYFNQRNICSILEKSGNRSVSDATLTKVVEILRGIAFELWQLYQNQLWVDLAERELKYGSKSSGNKVAFATTFGINRMVVANVSHEVYAYCNTVEAEAQKLLSSGAARSLDEPSSIPAVNLFSAPSWKVIDEALETSSSTPEVGQARAASTRPKNPVQQLVLVISGDLMMWGASKIYPALRTEIVKLFEKLFAWKFVDRVHREVAVICCRKNGSSISFMITDEKLCEKLTLTCVGSISEARELLHRDQKRAKGAVPVIVKGAAISKGFFSKRFSYASITNSTSLGSGLNVSVVEREKQPAAASDIGSQSTTRCRTFVSYRFVSDYRREFFDETLRFFPRVTLPKAVLGPVIGRMVLKEAPKAASDEPLAEGDPGDPVAMSYTVPILLEINADARVVCVVTDILANQDIRVVAVLTRYHPHVFEIPSLVPERRYVYRFEGIANSETRRGSFHTPSCTSVALNFVTVSSNFPEEMDESTDSLWAEIKKHVQVSWCGLDMVLHLGGQVPMQEAAFECFQWVRRELNIPQKSSEKDDHAASHEESLCQKVRQRLQQRYRLCWSVPNVRETLAHTSNWFLRSQADIAPFFRNHEVLNTKAAKLVLSEAKTIVADYQLSLMLHDSATDEITSELLSPRPDASTVLSPERSQNRNSEQPESSEKRFENDNSCTERVKSDEEEELGQNENELAVDNAFERRDTAQFIQTGEVGIFMCDMRSTLPDDVVTCNNRLVTPLTQQERAVIGEKQWLQLEKALKKKAIMIFVLCMELPLILTDAKHVDAMREEATFPEIDPVQEEAAGRWKLYDRQEISQHWVSCRRQLEQLLNLLFRWKAKHRGRDVIVLSGGMRVGLETMLHDRETKLSFRNLTVGPLTARVESDFANLPLAGVACPTFLGGARDERFTFAHKVVSSKNYLLTHAVVTREQTKGSEERGEVGGETKSASIETEFIADELADAAHPMTLYRRFPTWWANYVPMGKIVFWDDTVMMRAQSDEDVTALAQYLQDGREFTAALEVLFEKHQFAEAARMEELRSKHRRRRRGPEELRLSLRAVFAELWKVLPETHRQRVAYFQDEFVFDFLLGYLASDLFEDSEAQDDDVERPPLEFAAFSTLCRDFIFNAGMLNLCLVMQQEDERRALALQRAKARGQAAEREAQRSQQEQQRAEEEAELARLQRENPEEYAKRKLAEQEVARQEKLAKAEAARERRKAEKLRDVEEELAIAKEQRKLDKLAESGDDPQEFNRRRELLAARVRKLEERKRHRQAEEARRREMKEKKKKEKAAH